MNKSHGWEPTGTVESAGLLVGRSAGCSALWELLRVLPQKMNSIPSIGAQLALVVVGQVVDAAPHVFDATVFLTFAAYWPK